jgi:hypothetical protein
MAWDDDVLQVYEQKRNKALEAKRIATERLQRLNNEQPLQWKALRETFLTYCENFNAKVGRIILLSIDQDLNSLDIRREDDSKIDAKFNAGTRTVKFTSDVFNFEREFELRVMTLGGSDAVVWFCLQTESIDQVEEIAKSLLTNFLRAEQS